MKRLISATLFAITFLAASPLISAQDCSNWTNWDLRGTYVGSGDGYLDLSKLFPGKGFPVGLTPMSVVIGHVYNGLGGATGWVSMNVGGTQFRPEYTAYSYAMQADCSVRVTYTLNFKELGATLTFTRIGVIVPKPGGLEIHSHAVAKPFGTPAGAGLNLNVIHRISMQY
jgi:hypothetical protein